MSTIPRRNPFLRQLFAAHPQDLSKETAAVLALLANSMPQDDFSISQWELGLTYFRKRIACFELSGGLMLDLGCGTGNWSLAASDRFQKVIGLDARTDRLEVASQIRHLVGVSNVHFRLGDISRLPVADNSTDLVLAYNVLPYVVNCEAIIGEVYRVLRPGGFFWVSWHDVGVCLYYLAEGLALQRYRQLRSVVSVTLKRFLKMAGRNHRYYNGLYLRTNDVCQMVRSSGFIPYWESWASPPPGDTRLLFPQRMFGLPLFNEMILEKPRMKDELL